MNGKHTWLIYLRIILDFWMLWQTPYARRHLLLLQLSLSPGFTGLCYWSDRSHPLDMKTEWKKLMVSRSLGVVSAAAKNGRGHLFNLLCAEPKGNPGTLPAAGARLLSSLWRVAESLAPSASSQTQPARGRVRRGHGQVWWCRGGIYARRYPAEHASFTAQTEILGEPGSERIND